MSHKDEKTMVNGLVDQCSLIRAEYSCHVSALPTNHCQFSASCNSKFKGEMLSLAMSDQKE